MFIHLVIPIVGFLYDWHVIYPGIRLGLHRHRCCHDLHYHHYLHFLLTDDLVVYTMAVNFV